MRVPSISTVRFAVLVALVLGLFTSGIVAGAAGGPLILGQANAASGKTTTLSSNKNNGPVMKIRNPGNHRGLDIETEGGIPLKLNGPTNKAPMTVNSGVVVSNLNAGMVDGRDANALVRLAFANDDAVASGTDGTLTTTIQAPSRGWIAITGSAWVFNHSSTTPDLVECAIEVNNAEITGSERFVDVDFDSSNDSVICGSTVGFRVCSPGTYTIDMEFRDIAVSTSVFDGSVTAQFTPFSGAGSPPPILTCIALSPSGGGDQQAPTKD